MTRFKLYSGPPSPEDVAMTIENFLAGTGNPYDWDDFLSTSTGDERLDEIRDECARVRDRFPPTRPGVWCSDDGAMILQAIAQSLRKSSS